MFLISNLINGGASTDIEKPFRYLRLSDKTGVSKCELVEIVVYGYETSDNTESNGNLTCPISV